MNEQYTKMMLQQSLSADADAAFYEKLENAQTKKRMAPLLRVAVIAVCIGLLIPATVWAAESIFGVTKVTVCERPVPMSDLPGIGMDIVYENIENYALKDFPKHLQKLEEGEVILHSSLAEVEDYLGLDLIDNRVLAEEDTHQVGAFEEAGKNFQSYCGVWDGQFLFAEVQSVYNRNNIRFKVTAMATVEHPTIDEDYHSTNITYFDENNRQIHSEQYVTKAGIPVLIVTVTEDSPYHNGRTDYRDLLDCFAFFAVNNISYKIEFRGWSFGSPDLEKFASPEEKVMATLLEVLDGFVIE